MGPVKTERVNTSAPTDIWLLFRVAAQSGRLSSLRVPPFLFIFLALNRRIRTRCVYVLSHTRCANEGVGGGDRRAFNIARVENYDPQAFTLVFEVRSPVFRLIYRRRWSAVHDFTKGLSDTASALLLQWYSTTTVLYPYLTYLYIYIYTLERFLINS